MNVDRFGLLQKMNAGYAPFMYNYFLENMASMNGPLRLERSKMIHFIKTANQSFDIAYNDREILESSYLLADYCRTNFAKDFS